MKLDQDLFAFTVIAVAVISLFGFLTYVKLTADTMTLHDGTILTFRDTADCCAWFEAELKERNLTDNAITRVTTTRECGDEYGKQSWSIHILAADEHIADVNINGYEGSGYYCHSINLEVTNPDKRKDTE